MQNTAFSSTDFRYYKIKSGQIRSPNGELLVDNVRFTLKRGETVGLTGPSGSGKSIFVDSVLGLLPQESLEEESDNTCSGTVFRAKLDRNLGFLGQSHWLIQGSVKENLTLGHAGLVDDREVTRALRQVGLAEFIEPGNRGLSYQVEQGGLNLSGGQRQRMCLARELVRHPDFFIFDEPTSALDQASESVFLDLLRTRLIENTIILISHSPSVLALCDRVYEIKDKTLKEIR